VEQQLSKMPFEVLYNQTIMDYNFPLIFW